MDGIHDLGGLDGFGKVEVEQDEPVFHHPWEGRVLAINRAMGVARAWNIDMSRWEREQIPPRVYLESSYYKRWELAMEASVLKLGIADADELSAGHSLRGPKHTGPTLAPNTIELALRRGSYTRPTRQAPRFHLGDRVRTRNTPSDSHSRLPRYARGHLGTIERIHGFQVFPDSSSSSSDEDPQWLYAVTFTGTELWGEDGDPTITVSIDAFEPYLEGPDDRRSN